MFISFIIELCKVGESMKKKAVITISREYGSGGREVGRILAELLDIPFYDKELLTYMTKDVGIDENLFKNINTTLSLENFYYSDASLYTKAGSDLHNLGMLGLHERIQSAQENLITRLAKESCVIIGRCSDYILRNDPDAIHVFIRANLQDKKKRVTEVYGEKQENLNEKLFEKDRKRANYYQYFTNRAWSKATNYDLILSTSKLSLEGAAKVLENFVKERE